MKKEKIQIRRLRGTDAVSVKELDEISGNNVFQYIENVGPLQETEDAWGIFDNGLLLGYCSTGDAEWSYDEIHWWIEERLCSNCKERDDCGANSTLECYLSRKGGAEQCSSK